MLSNEFQELCKHIQGYDAIVVHVNPTLYRRFCFTIRCLTTGNSYPLTGQYGNSDSDYKAVGGAKVLRLTEKELINYRDKKRRLLNAIKDFV